MKGLYVKMLPLFVLLLSSCEVKMPKDIIRPVALEELLYDYHLAQAMSPDELKSKLYIDYVFKKHNVTKEQFDSTMIWYTRNPRHIYNIYDNLQKRLSAEVLTLDNSDSGGSSLAHQNKPLVGDTVNLWQGVKTALLSATPLCNRLQFNFVADTTFVAGDSLSLFFNVKMIQPVGRRVEQHAHAALVVEYADSTVQGDGCPINTSGHYAVNIGNEEQKEIKEVRGFIYYNDCDSLKEARMLIGDISIVRVHPVAEKESD